MPKQPAKPCRHPGCPNLTHGRFCKEHAGLYERQRDNSSKRGYNYRWQKRSKAFLRKHPLCAECLERGKLEAATVVDHKQPHRGDVHLFWNEDNWQPLCEQCHNRKTRQHDQTPIYKY